MVEGLTAHLKEEVVQAQFGKIINTIELFSFINNIDCQYKIVQQMKAIIIKKGDHIWRDRDTSDYIYFLQRGHAELFAENNYTFKSYAQGSYFGYAEMFNDVLRSGELIAIRQCEMYCIQKNKIESILIHYPLVRQKILAKSIADYDILLQARVTTLKKNVMYGRSSVKKRALFNIRKFTSYLND